MGRGLDLGRAAGAHHTARILLQRLSAARFNVAHEKRTQEEMFDFLRAEFPRSEIEREVTIAPGSIIDLLFESLVGIEVKLKGAQRRAVRRQIDRYLSFDRVPALILATNLSLSLPGAINGKPVFVLPLGRAWL